MPTAVATLIVLLLSTVAVAAEPATSPHDAELQRLRDRVAQLEQENAALRAELAQLRDTSADLQAQAQRVTAQRDDLLVERQTLEQLAGVTAKGEAVESAIARFETTYDAERDRTTVQSVSEKIDAGELLFRTEHHLRVRYEHAGQDAGQDASASPGHVLADVLTFISPSTRYRSLESATLVVDGESIELPVEHYEIVRTRRYGASVAGQRRYDELLTLRVDRELLSRIARGSEAMLRLGNVELPLDREHLALFGAAQRRLDGMP